MLRIVRNSDGYIHLEGGGCESPEALIGTITTLDFGEHDKWVDLCLPDPLWEEGQEVREALKVIWDTVVANTVVKTATIKTATILAKDIDQEGLFRAKAQAYIFGAYDQRGLDWWGNTLSHALRHVSYEPTLGCLNISFEEGKALLEEVLGYELE